MHLLRGCQHEITIPRSANEWSSVSSVVNCTLEVRCTSCLVFAVRGRPCSCLERSRAPRARTEQRLRRTPGEIDGTARWAGRPLGLYRPRRSFPDLYFRAGGEFLLSYRTQRRGRWPGSTSNVQERRILQRTARDFVSPREKSTEGKMERRADVAFGSRYRGTHGFPQRQDFRGNARRCRESRENVSELL